MAAYPDLEVRRDLGETLVETLRLFGSHVTIFMTLTALVVAPAGLLVDGLWGRQLQDGIDAEGPLAASIVSELLFLLVIPALVTALHVRVVQRLGERSVPTLGEALRSAAGRAPAAVAAVVLYAVAVVLGCLLLIAPGIWISVRWYFGAQAAVVDGLSPPAALRRSGEVVGHEWGRCFGYLLSSGLVALVPTLLLGIPLAAGASAVAGPVGEVVVFVVVQTALSSLGALFGTLLFFDLRAVRTI